MGIPLETLDSSTMPSERNIQKVDTFAESTTKEHRLKPSFEQLKTKHHYWISRYFQFTGPI